MLHERIYLDCSDGRAYIDTYVSDLPHGGPRDAMIVFPGGGYVNVCADREGEAIAEAYLARGFNAFVVRYRVGSGERYPTQLLDAARAVLHVRANAEKYNINPDRVFAVGFSAGGHLTGSLGLLCSDPLVLSELGVTIEAIRPNGIVLCYPVVTAQEITHQGSFINLLGKPYDELTDSERYKFSLENNVDENSPPAFIWHTAQDQGVPPVGSLRLCEAYIRNKVPVSLHIYPFGPHGIAMANRYTTGSEAGIQPLAQRWLDDSVDFLRALK